MKYFIFTILASLLVFNIALAHVGLSFEKQVGDYFIDIGSEEEIVTEGKEFELNFDLSKDDERQEFHDVSVKFSKDGEIFYLSRIHKPKIGPVHLLYIFPESGEYQMSVAFNQDDKTIVETDFSVLVEAKVGGEEQAKTGSTQGIIGAVIGFVIGIIIVSLFRRKP
jgi:hypothetical protein